MLRKFKKSFMTRNTSQTHALDLILLTWPYFPKWSQQIQNCTCFFWTEMKKAIEHTFCTFNTLKFIQVYFIMKYLFYPVECSCVLEKKIIFCSFGGGAFCRYVRSNWFISIFKSLISAHCSVRVNVEYWSL